MTTQESRIPLNPQLSKHNADNEVRTTMDDATLEELKGIMQFYVQGIQERQGQFVRLYHGAISRDSSALESVKMWLDHLAEREPQGDPLEMAFLQLLLDFEAKGKRISELMGEVLRLGDNRVQGSKDDHYFGQRLTGVFREVEDWVYQTFNNAPDIQHLGQEAEYSCSEAAGDRWRELLEKEHILLFTRVVTMELVKNVLEPRLLGINHDYIRLILPAIEESFVKNTNEDLKWRIKTIDILSNNKLFWEAFKTPANALATKLFTKFSGCTEKNPAGRIKNLTSLINDTGAAATECQTQPSEFRFIWLPPGSRYKPELASDANNMLGDQALNDKSKRWVIVMTVAPAVLRVEHGSEKEVVVVKARVLLEEGSPLWEEGSEEESFDDKSSQDTSEGEDGTSDEEGGISNEHDRGGEEHDGASEKDRSSGEDVGNRNARIEKHGECRGGITRDIDMNTGNEEHGVSEEQGIMPETPRNRENNLETEDIEHERASESTGSYEEGVRREAGWSGDERKEEENPERKKTEGEIDKQDEVEEWENRENDGSNEMDEVKEVAGHEAGISGDKTQVDIKVTGNKKGGNVDDKGSCGEEGSTYTADRDAEISPPRASADGMTCHNATERRDNSEKGKYCEDQDSRGDLDKAASNRNNAEQGANFEGLVRGEGVVSGGGERMMEEGGFEKKGQSCGEEECKSEETLKNEDTESCEEEDKGTQEEGSNTG